MFVLLFRCKPFLQSKKVKGNSLGGPSPPPPGGGGVYLNWSDKLINGIFDIAQFVQYGQKIMGLLGLMPAFSKHFEQSCCFRFFFWLFHLFAKFHLHIDIIHDDKMFWIFPSRKACFKPTFLDFLWWFFIWLKSWNWKRLNFKMW